MEQNNNKKFLIWSNGYSQPSIQEFAVALQRTDIPKDAIHIFLNTCVPLKANSKVFQNMKNYVICRECSEQWSPTCFFGYDEVMKFQNMLNRAFVYANDSKVVELEMSRINDKAFQKQWSRKVPFGTLDRQLFMKNYPKDKKDQETTGFAAYNVVKQLFHSEDIVLCNFGVKDERFKRTDTHHGISFEDQVFNEMKVKRLVVK